jgi:hypothetical protein
MFLASRFSLLAMIFLFIVPIHVFAQSADEFSGMYVSFTEPISETTAFKEFKIELKNRFPSISESVAFPGAENELLKNVLFYQVSDNSSYNSLKSYLEGQALVEDVLLEDLKIGEGASTSNDIDDEHLEYTESRSFSQACTTPYNYNDPGSLSTEHVNNMELPCAWTITEGDPTIVIAVVDNFFYPDHPDLEGRFTNVTSCNNPPASQPSHGTATSGAAAGIVNNGLCVAGGSFSSKVDAYCWNDGILNAMWAAHRLGRPIISLSAWSRTWASDNPMIRAAFQEIVDGGTVITYSVRGDNAINFAEIDGLIVVGMAWESGWFRTYDAGVPDRNIDMVVPSRTIFRLNEADCAIGPGNTSISSPYLAGTVALMLSVNPCLTPIDVERILKSTSKEIPNPGNTFGEINGGGNLNAYKAVLAAMDYDGPEKLTVSFGEHLVLTNETRAFTNVEILPGGRLDVNNCKISIEGNKYGQYNNGRIVVHRGAKLIARNSRLSNPVNANCENERWAGIRVHGNIDREQPDMFNANGDLEVNTPIAIDDAGVVMLLDNTIIQNAGNAVAATVPGLPYQDQVDRWGGLVIADRAVFRNNFRAAEFLRYPRRFSGHTFKNKSVFNECLFITTDLEDTRSLGITAWDTDGIRVTKSTFTNIGRESIATIDGSFIVENGNTFINERNDRNHRHIMSMATYPYSGAMAVGSEDEGLARNEFYSGNSVDIFVSGINTAGKGGLKVLNNDFYGRRGGNNLNYAVEIDGAATYQLRGNFIEGSNSFELRNTGLDLFSRGNLVSCNTINNSRYGMRFRENNAGLKFSGNVFTGDDISGSSIFVDGTVDLFQGNASQPANNRFSTVEQSSHKDISVDPNSPPFNYYYTDTGDPADDAFEPRGESNYNKIETSSKPISECLSGKPPTGNIKEEDVLAAQNHYLNIKSSANPNLLEEMQEVENAKVIRDDLVNDFIDLAILEQDLSKINSLLTKIPGPEAKMRHFGACLELGDHAGAKNLLSVIDGLGVGYNDFVDVQEINLDRLEISGEDYVLTTSDSITLDNIASSESEARGYARAVLYLLKGKRYYDNYEEKIGSGFLDEETSAVVKDMSPILTVYPNPVHNGKLKISGEIIRGNGMATVRRMDGSVVSAVTFSDLEELTIDAPLVTGIYFIQVTRGEETAMVKVIVR